MSRRDVNAGEGEQHRGENANLVVELRKADHPQNVQQHIKDKQVEHDTPYKSKRHSISTYLAIFQWILLIFCVFSNIYLLTKPSDKCECDDGSSAQTQRMTTTSPTNSPQTITSLFPTSHPFVRSSVDPTAFPSTQPSLQPTSKPIINPSFGPTVTPTESSTGPTVSPSFSPIKPPTEHPSLAPSESPSHSPTCFDGYFAGDYKYSFRNSSHGFWLLCHGQWLDIAQYPSLYDVMGYQFGDFHDTTNDTLYFRIPDARDTVMGVVGSVHPMGENIGNETYTLSEGEMPGHTHWFGGPHSGTCVGDMGTGTNLALACGSHSVYEYRLQKTPTAEDVWQTQNSGENQSFPLMQPTKFIGNLFVYSGETHS